MKAIILAAGMGTRLEPITNSIPKPLIKVNGVSIIERQIEYLKEIGITEIIIVTGYMHEKFDYLVEKYGITKIYNDKYDVYNNGYTMYLVKDYIKDSFILEGDVYLTNNFLTSDLKNSAYFSGIKESYTNEWELDFNERNKVLNINIGNGSGYIMSGISYWNEKDGEKISEYLDEMVASKGFKNLFWDSLVKDNLDKFDIEIHKIKSNDWVEIDSIEDLKLAESKIFIKQRY